MRVLRERALACLVASGGCWLPLHEIETANDSDPSTRDALDFLLLTGAAEVRHTALDGPSYRALRVSL